MELCVNDVTTAGPSADDIERAVDATPLPEDWYLSLDSGDGTVIDADVRSDGTFDVSATTQGRDLVAKPPLDATQLKDILVKMQAGDPSWMTAPFWEALPRASRAGRAFKPPTWALAIIVGSVVLVVLAFMLLRGRHNAWREALPFGNSDFFWIGLIFLPMVVLVVVAILVKLIEMRRAATWPSTMGRIVRSENQEERHTNDADQVTVTTVAVVEYEFTVAGRTWRGNRVSIGETLNTDATLERYPVGRVVEVFYDAADPRNCVLERDPWSGRNA
ncbi:MAG: DUF3592 domain-containing protein [Reyranellaceae bacterium]